MKKILKKTALILVLFSSSLYFISCEEEDNNKVDPAFEIPGIDIPNQLKNPPEIIELKNTVCESFDNQIKPITQEEQNLLFAKDEVDISNQILIELNLYRKSKGLSELSNNNTARFLALQHNDYQIALNDINHDNSQFRSCSIFKLEQVRSTGENVAFGFKTAKSVVQGWLDSPSHLANIEGDFSNVGIGTTKNENGILYYTNIFFKQ